MDVELGRFQSLSWSARRERFEVLFALPHRNHDDGQLPCDCDGRSLLGGTSLGELQSPSPQRSVGPKRAQDVLGAVDQQLADKTVTSLRDPEVRIARPALKALWRQPEEGSNVARLREAGRVLDCENEGIAVRSPTPVSVVSRFASGYIVFTISLMALS